MEEKGYTLDGTVNLNGDPVLSSTTGKWKACIFILGRLLLVTLFLRKLITHTNTNTIVHYILVLTN